MLDRTFIITEIPKDFRKGEYLFYSFAVKGDRVSDYLRNEIFFNRNIIRFIDGSVQALMLNIEAPIMSYE